MVRLEVKVPETSRPKQKGRWLAMGEIARQQEARSQWESWKLHNNLFLISEPRHSDGGWRAGDCLSLAMKSTRVVVVIHGAPSAFPAPPPMFRASNWKIHVFIGFRPTREETSRQSQEVQTINWPIGPKSHNIEHFEKCSRTGVRGTRILQTFPPGQLESQS